MFFKYPKISIERIKTYFVTQKLIIVLFIIGNVLSAIGFAYFYGNFTGSKVKTAQNSTDYRSYKVTLNEKDCVENDALSSFDGKYKLQDIETVINTDVNFTDIQNTTNPLYQVSKITIISLYKNNNEVYDYDGRLNFKDNELTQDTAIISSIIKLDDEIFILDMDFKIVGRINNFIESYFFVPVNSSIKSGQINSIKFILKDIPNASLNADVMKTLSEMYPHSYISDPYVSILIDEERDYNILLPLAGMFSIIIITFLFLYKYIIDINVQENFIYRFVGAKKSSVLAILFMEISILSLLCSAIGFAIHSVFYESLFNKINIYEDIAYNLQDYILVQHKC